MLYCGLQHCVLTKHKEQQSFLVISSIFWKFCGIIFWMTFNHKVKRRGKTKRTNICNLCKWKDNKTQINTTQMSCTRPFVGYKRLYKLLVRIFEILLVASVNDVPPRGKFLLKNQTKRMRDKFSGFCCFLFSFSFADTKLGYVLKNFVKHSCCRILRSAYFLSFPIKFNRWKLLGCFLAIFRHHLYNSSSSIASYVFQTFL